MAVLWLDLNAYVPKKNTELIVDYDNDFLMRTVSGNTASAWRKIEKRNNKWLYHLENSFA